MKIDKVKIALSLVLVVTVFGILALFFWDFIRDTIGVPIYYLIWVGDLFLKSVPQEVYLIVLIFISIIMSSNTLERISTRRVASSPESNRSHADTRYLHWRRLCTKSYSSPFSRDQFAWETRTLILSILAYEQGIDVSEAENRVRNGTLWVPDPIRYLVQQRKIRTPQQTTSRLKSAIRRLRRLFLKADPSNDPQINNQVAEIIGFLEHHLE